MPRLRLGVALLVPRPVAGEIDVLRRACGDQAVRRIAPHLTLVPPVNVREDRVEDALRVLRSAAAATRPIMVTLGPPTTFLPTNPVLYLAVGGEVEAVAVLRDRVFVEPLARSLTWGFHPHVTVVDGAEPERLDAAVTALAGYRAEVTFSQMHLLQERRDEGGVRVWHPIADVTLGATAVVGRGGLELQLAVGDQLGPDARAFEEREWATGHGEGPTRAGRHDVAVTARRKGRVVGTARGWTRGPGAELDDLIVAGAHRREGIGAHVVAAFVSEVVERGCRLVRARTEAGSPGEGFLRRLGWVEEARFDAAVLGPGEVQLRRDLTPGHEKSVARASEDRA
ncbi:MAG TPA: GNAT family N-acetyltransferase, partial [Acidimicrobiales bacterium]|nr:GNAT family N-acetyltransferase [Acidimicrobiales bacterium]